MKKENPDRSFGEMNREIGTLWTTLSQEKKQVIQFNVTYLLKNLYTIDIFS